MTFCYPIFLVIPIIFRKPYCKGFVEYIHTQIQIHTQTHTHACIQWRYSGNTSFLNFSIPTTKTQMIARARRHWSFSFALCSCQETLSPLENDCFCACCPDFGPMLFLTSVEQNKQPHGYTDPMSSPIPGVILSFSDQPPFVRSMQHSAVLLWLVCILVEHSCMYFFFFSKEIIGTVNNGLLVVLRKEGGREQEEASVQISIWETNNFLKDCSKQGLPQIKVFFLRTFSQMFLIQLARPRK